MKKFLEAVAEGYAAKIMKNPEVPAYSYVFVFPNKRAGTFFQKYFRSAMSGYDAELTSLSPKVTTITEFTENLSGRIVESRVNLLFLLYRCYCSLLAPASEGAAEGLPADAVKAQEALIGFDSFRRWGETALSDFNEVDMHLGEPEELFKNVSDFRRLTSTFLTEEQRRVIEEYFGYSARSYEDDKFWVDFGDELEEETSEGMRSENRRKFVRLWKILHPLYVKFNEEMARRGIATSGLSYRLAGERLAAYLIGEERLSAGAGVEDCDALGADGKDLLLRVSSAPVAKIVMVGFNALSGAERRIFKVLKELDSPLIEGERLGDFVWDATGPVILKSNNTAGHFVKMNIKDFPAPEWLMPWLAQSNAGNSMPRIHAIASPSEVMQVKIASDVIARQREEIGEEAFSDARVALVLPDEGLLLPMLYSIPGNISDANLTMGYPLKLTSVNSFLALLRRLQLMRRDSSQYKGYAYQEVNDMLSHPYAQGIIGSGRIRKFRREFESRHRSVVRDSDLRPFLGEAGERLLTPLALDASPAEVIAYLDSVLEYVEQALERRGFLKKLKGVHNSVETQHVSAWRDALRNYGDAILEYGIRMSVPSVMAEANRLLQGEVVPFEGEPLKGLQIMGLLETRALDFDHLTVVSVNDKVIPRRSRRRSFLPNIIRRGYGLPPINYSETIFSYYFYRMLSRAKDVTLIYDGRASGVTGGVSRYLMQLKYLHGRSNLQEIEYQFNPKSNEFTPNVVEKKPLMERLMKYTKPAPEGKRRKNYSASLMKRYLECSLKFYLYGLMNLRDDSEEPEGVSNITYGNIVHKMMEMIYLPEEEVGEQRWLERPVEVTEEFLSRVIADEEGLYRMARRLINKEHYKEKKEDLDKDLAPDTQVVAEAVVTQVKRVLEYDMSLAPFKIYGCEVSEELSYTTSSGITLNMTYAIDRIDDAGCEGNDLTVRIIDYKTGNPKTRAESIEDVFSGDFNTEHIFQLLFYALMMNEKRKADGRQLLDVRPMVYNVAGIFDKRKRELGLPSIGKQRLGTVSAEGTEEDTVLADFRALLDSKLEEIYDESIPFRGDYNTRKCQYCPFTSICKK